MMTYDRPACHPNARNSMISSDRLLLIRSRAASLLLAQKPQSPFAMGLLDLRRFRGDFLLDTMEGFSTLTSTPLPAPQPDGMTLLRKNGKPLILYASSLSPARRNFTLAHEMGHILLSHHAPSPSAEREANAFASALLMPPIVIAAWEEEHGYRMDEEEILRCFAVSRTAAQRCRSDLDGHPILRYAPEEHRLIEALWRRRGEQDVRLAAQVTGVPQP